MKKLWFTGVLFAIMMIVVPAMATTTTILYAGQYIPVGEVTVNDEYHTITYNTWDGWEMTETHLAIAAFVEEIPQTQGGPIPGQFEYSTVHNPPMTTVTYDGIDPSWWDEEEFYVAAHAAVVHTTTGVMDVVSSTNTNVIEVNGKQVTVPQKAVAANEPFDYPNCDQYTPLDNSKSEWDDGIGKYYDTFATATPAADWIWNTLNPENPIKGDVVKFQEKFTIPGDPKLGMLYITADNGYEATLNGAAIAKAQLGPGFPTTLKEQVGDFPQTGDWGVASWGWKYVKKYSFSESALVNGENTLDITAANEYMWDEPGTYQGPDFFLMPDGFSYPDPNPGDGISICRNPAGLIYRVRIAYTAVDRQETAWADGTAFPGKNWATYFWYQEGN